MLNLIWGWITNWVFGWGSIGAFISIGAWLLWYFTPALLIKFKVLLLQIAVAATVFTFASTYFFTSGYNKGYATAIHAVAAKDQKAIDRVKDGERTVASCRAGGGTWNVSTGECDR